MEENIFDAKNLSPREQVAEWVKIKENIGDSISGAFVGWWIVPEKTGFKQQLGIAIKRKDGVICGINLNDTQYYRDKLAVTQVGDMIGLRYESDKDTGKPQKAKIIPYYNATQKEREARGEKSVGTVASTVNETTDAAEGEQPPF